MWEVEKDCSLCKTAGSISTNTTNKHMNDSAGRSVFLFPRWIRDSNRSYLAPVHNEVYGMNAVKGFGG